MSEGLLGEVTATYVLKNRENGWLKYALQVLAAGPYLRRTLISELCEDVRQSLERGLPGHKVAAEAGEGATWFSLDIRSDAWGEFGVSLGNWKEDASEVAIGVYNYGEGLSDTASARDRGLPRDEEIALEPKAAPAVDMEHLAGSVGLESSRLPVEGRRRQGGGHR